MPFWEALAFFFLKLPLGFPFKLDESAEHACPALPRKVNFFTASFVGFFLITIVYNSAL
jgi:hypothetical protein